MLVEQDELGAALANQIGAIELPQIGERREERARRRALFIILASSILNAMLEMGASKPWPDALEAFIGTREMDGSAMVEYFAPLMTWLQEQNADRDCGW